MEGQITKEKVKNMTGQITYQKLFWLFMIGSIIGVPLEGFCCLITKGHWETHVVTIWGPFCIIYGIGAVVFYLSSVAFKNKNMAVQFFAISLSATIVEYLCSWILEYALHMKAWDYSHHFLNIDGRVSLKMSLIWGVIGIAFIHFFTPHLEHMFEKMRGNSWRAVCCGLSIFMIVNFAFTSVCLVRWKDRHEGISPTNQNEQMVDEKYNDSVMEKRFCEWSFIKKR